MIHVELNRHANDESDSGAAACSELLPVDWPNRSLSRIVQAGDRRWHVQEAGRGESLLMLHGTGASSHSFRALLPLLANRFHVVALDLPGHGFTERRNRERLSLDQMSGAIARLLDNIDVRPRYVVGHSAGAAIALRMALDSRVAPAAIVGLNPALFPFGGAWQSLISPLTRLMAAADVTSKLISGMAKDPAAISRMISSTGSHLDDEGTALYRQLLLRPAHAAGMLSMMANWELGGMVDELSKLKPRLSLITAERDLAVPPEQVHRVAEAVPKANVVVVADGGHLVHEERPSEIFGLIENALCGTAEASPDSH